MTQNAYQGILEKGYQKLITEYQQMRFPDVTVKKFGLNPGCYAVIETNGYSGVAISFHDNNPLYGGDHTGLDLEYLKTCIGRPLFEIAGIISLIHG